MFYSETIRRDIAQVNLENIQKLSINVSKKNPSLLLPFLGNVRQGRVSDDYRLVGRILLTLSKWVISCVVVPSWHRKRLVRV